VLRGGENVKAGDKVMIYEDPITRKKEEGIARLVECLDVDEAEFLGDRLERWLVDFDDDYGPLERTILFKGGDS
jgi:hypothetical protein